MNYYQSATKELTPEQIQMFERSLEKAKEFGLKGVPIEVVMLEFSHLCIQVGYNSILQTNINRVWDALRFAVLKANEQKD